MPKKRSPAILERPVLSVDVVLLCLDGERLCVLLDRRATEPFEGAWTLPGVAVRVDETLEAAARRALREKVTLPPRQVDDLPLEQLATFDALYRDPRGRTVSVAYLGLTRSPMDLEHHDRTRWRPVAAAAHRGMPFDHGEILQTAVERLRGKLRYTNIAAHLLPETFRIEDLQAIYEAVLDRKLNRANFRNKLLRIGLIQQEGVLAGAVGQRGGRPPHAYSFTAEAVEALDRDFL